MTGIPLEQEFKYYLANQKQLVEKYDGRFIVIKDNRVLEVYDSPADDHPFLNIEVIDSNTLWKGYDGWLFQLRRKGASGRLVPLTKRESSGND